MRKITIIAGTVILIGVLGFGFTYSYFTNTGLTSGDLTTGTLDIVGQGSWMGTYNFSNIYPGQDTRGISFSINNQGTLPVRIWMVLKNVSNNENGISEPEQVWYDANGQIKNDIDSVMVYSLDIDGNLVLEENAGITVGQVKNYYVNLVKTDQPFEQNNGDGIFYPGDTLLIDMGFYLPQSVRDWAQSDIMDLEIEILAQQVESPEPIKQLSTIQNKLIPGDWSVISDERVGLLRYNSIDQEFDFDFIAQGMESNENYNLVYYIDPYASQNIRVLSNILASDANGMITSLDNSVDIGNIPNSNDDNYPYGGKIWLVKSSKLSSTTAGDIASLTWSNNGEWLYDNWPGLIRYNKDTYSNGTQTETVYFNDLGTDPQFGPTHDYSTASVSFSYDTPANNNLMGTITGSGLKESITYQVKFIGKPTCYYGVNGDDQANEYVGYKGRWTCLDCSCSGASCNRSDAQYQANKSLPEEDQECLAGYLVWDYFTADNSGSVAKQVKTDNSYHVLWCSGGICGQTNNSELIVQDPYPICDALDVNGEIERFTCDGLVLDSGEYDLEMVLTEESFHQSSYGTWTTVMSTDINFEIR